MPRAKDPRVVRGQKKAKNRNFEKDVYKEQLNEGRRLGGKVQKERAKIAKKALEKSKNGEPLSEDEKEAMEKHFKNVAKRKAAHKKYYERQKQIKEAGLKGSHVAKAKRDAAKKEEDPPKVSEKKLTELVNQAKKEKTTDKQLGTMVRTLCDIHNYNPVEELIKKAANPRTSVKDKMAINRLLLPYMTPQLKSVDVSGQIDNTITINVQRFTSERPVDIPAWEEGAEHQIGSGKLPPA